jgi:subtilase family serine protease
MAAALAIGTISPASAAGAQTSTRVVAPSPAAGVARATSRVRTVARTFAVPPTTADCQAQIGINCYDPSQLQTAYDLAPLYKQGLNGRGRTIAIVDSFGSPTIRADLATFDAAFGLPAPPKFDVIQPAGPVPAYDSTNSDMVGWAQETTLDVEWAHSIAPGANLVLVETPVSETEGTQGFPEIVKAENYVIDHGLADVITQSFGATEPTFPSTKALLDLRGAILNAARHGVTVLGSSGDAGPTDYMLDGQNLYTHPVNSWPSSDPLVTSVGGTQLHLDATGNRTAPDNVWNDTALLGGPAASGGGLSAVFARPDYQDVVKRVVGTRRGTPDISMSAAVDGGVLVYTSFDGYGVGYHIFGGTSEASPLFSGVVAITAQLARHRLGALNPALYALGSHRATGIVDVTAGDNTVTFDQNGTTYTVQGSAAVAGYDLATGWGTIDAAKFVPALARS